MWDNDKTEEEKKLASISAVSTVVFPHLTDQQEVKRYVREMFSADHPIVEQALDIFENAEIKTRNFCQPFEYYKSLHGFGEQNKAYISIAVDHAAAAIRQCARQAGVEFDAITDIIFVSSTGLATPSIDARLINRLKLNLKIRRYPLWGLGCGGGVSGLAKAAMITEAYPDAVVLLVAVELCSLTFLKNDFNKSNFVATSLFSDGIAAVIVQAKNEDIAPSFRIVDSESRMYYDTEDIMGWEFLDSGFKIIFSRDIPDFIHHYVSPVVNEFLARNGLELKDISNFIFHPGGKKVISAYIEALGITDEDMQLTHNVINDYGNMSSPTVLYVLQRFMQGGAKPGYGLMLALGPGFCTELVLLKIGS